MRTCDAVSRRRGATRIGRCRRCVHDAVGWCWIRACRRGRRVSGTGARQWRRRRGRRRLTGKRHQGTPSRRREQRGQGLHVVMRHGRSTRMPHFVMRQETCVIQKREQVPVTKPADEAGMVQVVHIFVEGAIRMR